MRLKIDGLINSSRTYRQTKAAAQYVNDSETFPGELKIKAILSRESGLLHLDLSVRIKAHFNCDRCGEAFDRPVTAREEYYYSFETQATATLDPDLYVIPKGALEIDVSQEIRDLLLLNLPFRNLCRKDCLGLCSVCGVNLNEEPDHQHEEVDPRWAVLQKLKEKKQ
jgi:uncharacterized protein